MASVSVRVRVVIDNPQAVRDLEYVARVLADAAESQPWNDELPKAARRMRRALRQLRPQQVKP